MRAGLRLWLPLWLRLRLPLRLLVGGGEGRARPLADCDRRHPASLTSIPSSVPLAESGRP